MSQGMEELRLPAPAKLNLMLRIIGRRSDGYHLLQTVFQFIDRCDWITMRRRADGAIRLATPLPGVPAESDLTVRAANLLRERSGGVDGVDISVEKILPMGGGLGGGSSDAATILVGLNRLWSAGLTLEELLNLGLKLGADVPVFIKGHAAWAEGVGEILTPIDPPESWYLVLVPPCQVATGKIFSSPDLTRDNEPIKMASFVAGQRENHCSGVVLREHPEIQAAMDALSEFSQAHLTGTGACVFASFDAEGAASEALQALSPKWAGFVAKGLNRSPLYHALDRVS